MKSIHDNFAFQRSLDPDVRTASANGEASVDTRGYSEGELVAIAGDISVSADETYTIKLSESDDNSTFTDSGISVVFDAAGDANSIAVARIADLNTTRKRYLRADLVVAGTTKSFEGGAMIVLGEPASGPVNS